MALFGKDRDRGDRPRTLGPEAGVASDPVSREVEMFGERAHVRIEPGAPVTEKTLMEALGTAGMTVESIRPIAASLEDVFIARLAHAVPDANADASSSPS